LPGGSATALRLRELTGGIDYGPPVDMNSDDVAPLHVLPSQWQPRGALCACGCQRLALEVLINAANELHHRIPKTRQQALQFFMQPQMDVIIDLADVCDALGLDPMPSGVVSSQ
jgi:hypothetical protein